MSLLVTQFQHDLSIQHTSDSRYVQMMRSYHIGCICLEIGRSIWRCPQRESELLVVCIVGIKHRDADGSLQVNLVDGQSKGVDDEVVELHVIPAWLHDLEVLPLFDAEQAPDNEAMIAIHCLCSFIDRLALLEYLMSFE